MPASWLLTLPAWGAALITVVVPTVVAGGLVYAVRRRWRLESLLVNNTFAAITYPLIGVIYGVFLAFTLVVSWQGYTDAQQTCVDEVASLSDLLRDTRVFPEEVQRIARDKTRRYADLVVTREWASMARAQPDSAAEAAFTDLWQVFYSFQPQGTQQLVFYEKALDELNQAATSRRERLVYSTADTPDVLWWYLLFGALVCVAFCYVIASDDRHVHALSTAAIAGLICFSLFVLLNLRYPFAGDMSVSSAPFVSLAQALADQP